LINNICQACSAGTAFDGSQCSSKASNSCGSNQVSVNGQCVCANGFYLVNSQCISCPAYTTWNGSYCACNSSDSSQWCIGQPFTKVDSTGSCSCQNGYILTNGICVQSNWKYDWWIFHIFFIFLSLIFAYYILSILIMGINKS
jgi:hypothetical protein